MQMQSVFKFLYEKKTLHVWSCVSNTIKMVSLHDDIESKHD